MNPRVFGMVPPLAPQTTKFFPKISIPNPKKVNFVKNFSIETKKYWRSPVTSGLFRNHLAMDQARDHQERYGRSRKRFLWQNLKKKIETPIQNYEADLKFSATLTIAPWMIPHDEKIKKGGEDAYFISENGIAMGIFDGVGGWAEQGIDPREYSYTLSEECRKAVDQHYISDPLEILKYGYERSLNVIGSSTACIVVIMGNTLHAINVGDSGFRVIRDNEIVCSSTEQQHTFNMPFQLGQSSEDKPENGEIIKFILQDGDYVLLGTDGLFDNLSNSHIISTINKVEHESDNKVLKRRKHRIQYLAEAIATEAYLTSKNVSVATPFSLSANQAGYDYTGGKEDDISLIFARFKEMTAKL